MRHCLAALVCLLISVAPAIGQGKRPADGAPSASAPVAALASFVAHERVGAFVLFSRDGKQLISGGGDNLIQIWDMRTGDEDRTLIGHTSGVTCGALSMDGKMLVTGSWDRTVRIWDIESGNAKQPLRGHMASVDAVATAADRKTIASAGSDRTFRLWDPESRETKFISPLQDLPVHRIAISPDGKLLATGTGMVSEWRRAGEVKLWNAATGEEVATLPGHSACVNAVVFSPDGKQLATGTADGMLRLWDVAGQEEVSNSRLGYGVRTIAFFADGRTLAIGRWPGRVFLLDAATLNPILAYSGHETPDAMVDSIALSPDQSLIASTGTDGRIYLWPVPESTPDGKRMLWKMAPGGARLAADLVREWESVAPGAAAGPKAGGKK